MSLQKLGILLFPILCSCGSGGGSEGARQVTLDNLVFPDPTEQSTGRDVQVPDNASIVQRIEFVFSDVVPLDALTSGSLQLVDESGERVEGRFVRNGRVVTFYPRLPRSPVLKLGPKQWDNGGAALSPDSFYDLIIPVGTTESIPSLIAVSERLWKRYDFQRTAGESYVGRNYEDGARSGIFSIRFKTTDALNSTLSGYDSIGPRLTTAIPSDGSKNVSPFLFTDPGNSFANNGSIQIQFDHPLDPSTDNLNSTRFALINLSDEQGEEINIELGSEVTLIENEFDHAIIEITPSGILPLGNKIAVTYPGTLRGIAGASINGPDIEIATVFDVAAKSGNDLLRDVFEETFSTNAYQETEFSEFDPGTVPAEWNMDRSGDLSAGYSFDGGGELGPFIPIPPAEGQSTIILDTNSQSFPLFDGSTPSARPGTVITGGVFNFTRISIPPRVVVKGQGINPLVLTATEDVEVYGEIDISGINGNSDSTYDSAIAPTPSGPGGPGGGSGGVGNPSIYDGTSDDLMRLVPPRFGEGGFGALGVPGIGGRGGEGCMKANAPIYCNVSFDERENNGSRGAGGGGGSMLTQGASGRRGNPAGGLILVSLEKVDPNDVQRPQRAEKEGPALGGTPGDLLFLDENEENDFIGPLGEVPHVIGGQGGGGGGNRFDSAYCYAFYPGFPGVVTEAKPGGGGGGGGAVVIKALGIVTVGSTALLRSEGGTGGCGETLGCSSWGGGAGGGSGGAIVIQSASHVIMEAGSRTRVGGGAGCAPANTMVPLTQCGARDGNNPGAGGRGGAGIVQVQVPVGVSPGLDGSISPSESLIDPEKTPSELTPTSIAQSRWINVGEVIRRGQESPKWSFDGTDKRGRIITTKSGNILDAHTLPFEVDLPPVIDPDTGRILEKGHRDFIPPGAHITVQFQSGDAIVPGSNEVDPSSILPGPTLWSSDIEIGQGHQFLRYRITFNIADLEQGYTLTENTRSPVIRSLRLPFEF